MVSPFLYANSMGTDYPDMPDVSRLTILSSVSILLLIDTLSPLIKNGFLLSGAVNFRVASVHPETPDETLLFSNSEKRDFLSWQGNQGVVRRRTSVRRTSKPED